MSLVRTVLPALGVERPTPSGPEGGAFGRFPGSAPNEMLLAVCFPHEDPRFAECVRGLFDGFLSRPPVAAAVQALLRETYPLAVISPRHELAALDGGRVWYAFRDGSAMPRVDREAS